MAPDPEPTTPKPERKSNQIKDLPPKEPETDAADKAKGGAVGPCDRSRKSL
jgi:hypothetical protein